MTNSSTAATTAVNPVSAAIEAAKQINSVVSKLEAARDEFANALKTVEGEIAVLWRMPLTRDEVKALALQTVDSLAAEFISNAKWADIVAPFAAPAGNRPRNDGPVSLEQGTFTKHGTAINLQDVDALARFSTFSGGLKRLLGTDDEIDFFTGRDQGPSADARRACFFFGDIIKSKIEKHFDRLLPRLDAKNGAKQASPELSIEQRRDMIEQCESRADELRSQIAAVDLELDQLAEARGLKDAARRVPCEPGQRGAQ